MDEFRIREVTWGAVAPVRLRESGQVSGGRTAGGDLVHDEQPVSEADMVAAFARMDH